MKILEITNYTAGADGVFSRVKRESFVLAKLGHEVKIFSTNKTKGSSKIATKKETLNEDNIKVEVERFKSVKLGGESYMYWNFKKEALNFNPDLIIAHSYRHLHTHMALKIGKKLNIPVLLVTHAPFERSSTRNFLEKIIVYFYDKIIGKKILNKFTKVIAITKWEISHLKKIGLEKEKIIYLPNGTPKIFFSKAQNKKNNKIIYLGRISPIKNLEVVLEALSLNKSKEIFCKFFGPAEEKYLKKLNRIIKIKGLKNIEIINQHYDIKKQLKELDSSFIFILPSKSEGMPQALIEAMARKKIVVASDIIASRELIKNGKNGFLFPLNDSDYLAKLLDKIINLPNAEIFKIQNEARKSVEQFSWKNLSKKLDNLITSLKQVSH